MLLRANESGLLLIDVQEKLTPHVLAHDRLIANCSWLLRLANKLNIPVIGSEQYPKGLGPTVPSLHELVPKNAWMEKVHFSCAEDVSCAKQIQSIKRQQIILIGIETHVCVLQTAFGLRDLGKDVFVVADATSARNASDIDRGLQRMRHANIQVVTKEMVFFEWVHQAGTEEFKALSKEFMR